MRAAGPNLPRIVTVSVILTAMLYAVAQLVLKVPPEAMLQRAGGITAVLGVFWVYFDRYGWRKNPFRLGGWLCDYPDLNGRWVGTVERHGDAVGPHGFVMEITQTYLNLMIHTFSKNSTGASITAQLLTNDTRTAFQLIATWSCRTKKLSGEDENEDFIGTSVIDISDDGVHRFLDDQYFTRRNPPTRGRLRLKWNGDVRLNRFE